MAIQPPGSYVQANKRGKTKKVSQDAFLRKEWYLLRSPTIFSNNVNGKTLMTKSAGKNSYLNMLGRRYDVNQADLTGNNSDAHRKFLFKVGDIKGNECIGFFDGMEITSDKQKAMIKKWHSLIEAEKDIVAKDGSIFRVFAMAITKRTQNYIKKTCYTKSSEEKRIRKVMVDVITEELSGMDVQKIMKKLSNETIGKRIEELGSEIFPLQSCCVRKVKTIKSYQASANQDAVEMKN
ncbi:ribosomal protein S3AE [Ordospora colligata]|uniref:Small ribosomal subunit protein eS1 n=1 Tax=Ordospora colligata OC4 TaxID=1354746 RepID=A0A0B2UMH2_9MICR|nr:ribosomal protein S3AE [Ordospora colligata OC4]KHN70578.1 ribosomal protein S3AE [Ordospora colligata OC4]TBU17328.1 ribosomal protein S3AE [Ordospora colligata]TBU17578.1 ribosomal protein S3AE [Ordospora colligata]TBU19758.1 ribosomal protein S3AE [Ordospora colligata]